MRPNPEPVSLPGVLRAVEQAIGEQPGAIKGIVGALVFSDDALGFLHNAPDLGVAQAVFAAAYEAVVDGQQPPFTIAFL